MSHLEDEHGDVFTHLKSGGFAVRLEEDNPFGKIPFDQACEEIVNNDTQTPGGTKGCCYTRILQEEMDFLQW